MKKIAIIFALCVFGSVSCVFAQDNKQLVSLSKQIIEAKNYFQLYPLFEELKAQYCVCAQPEAQEGVADAAIQDCNKYSEFVEFLGSLGKKKRTIEPFVDYYIAEASYCQLKYLEEKQNWDEYFNKGNDYRQQIVERAQKTIAATGAKEPLNIYSRLLLWKFHKDQADTFQEAALDELMGSTLEYAQALEDINVIKTVADTLSGYGEKAKAKELYNIYVHDLLNSNITDAQLKDAALDFYKKGNLGLSESLYELYIGKLTKGPEAATASIPELVEIARQFSYPRLGEDKDKPNDPVYAEKLFVRIEELGGNQVFDEDLIYLRALNLEKSKDYAGAAQRYRQLLEAYPEGSHSDEVNYKLGVIEVYLNKNIDAGRGYFEKLSAGENVSPQAISSLYQLGLLGQYQEDLEKAKGYYNQLIEKAGESFSESKTQAQQRLGEIGEGKPLDYNSKAFLDLALGADAPGISASGSGLNASPAQANTGETISISSGSVSVGETGCMPVELQYFWGGDSGAASAPSNVSEFSASFNDPGTKIITAAVSSPSGMVDGGLLLVDIY